VEFHYRGWVGRVLVNVGSLVRVQMQSSAPRSEQIANCGISMYIFEQLT
jgi:hypothetical protein